MTVSALEVGLLLAIYFANQIIQVLQRSAKLCRVDVNRLITVCCGCWQINTTKAETTEGSVSSVLSG